MASITLTNSHDWKRVEHPRSVIRPPELCWTLVDMPIRGGGEREADGEVEGRGVRNRREGKGGRKDKGGTCKRRVHRSFTRMECDSGSGAWTPELSAQNVCFDKPFLSERGKKSVCAGGGGGLASLSNSVPVHGDTESSCPNDSSKSFA